MFLINMCSVPEKDWNNRIMDIMSFINARLIILKTLLTFLEYLPTFTSKKSHLFTRKYLLASCYKKVKYSVNVSEPVVLEAYHM